MKALRERFLVASTPDSVNVADGHFVVPTVSGHVPFPLPNVYIVRRISLEEEPMRFGNSCALVLALICPPLCAAADSLTANHIQNIKQLHEKYRQAWLAGDPEAVRAVFVEEPVLLPHHGVAPVVGKAQLNNFWFPPGAPATKVLRLDLTYKEIGGSGTIAYVWGTHAISWVSAQNGTEKVLSEKGTYLNILRRLPDGSWRISHRMWDDPIPTP